MVLATPLKGAVIGCGYVSQFHLEAWKRVPDAEIVAICDVDLARLEAAGERLPEAKRFENASAMFEECGLDFVEICTRPDSHRELTEAAARYGVHVLCQKPAAAIRPDLRAMIETCDSVGTRLMIHENWRFRPWYRAMRADIDAGLIGRPIRIRLSHRDMRSLRPGGYHDQPYFASMPKLILLEMGPHLVDTARYLIGEVQTVNATLGRFSKANVGEDLATLSLYFNGGTLGLLDMSWCGAADSAKPEWAINETVVEGTSGALRLLTDGSLELVTPLGRVERRPVKLPAAEDVYLDGYVAAQNHFIRGLIDDVEHETRGSDNLKTMEVVWAAYRSAEEGCTLSV